MIAPDAVRQAKAILRADRRARKAAAPRMDAGPKLEPTPGENTKRKRLTRAERDLILTRQDNNCDKCHETLIWSMIGDTAVFGPMIDEHILPLELKGSNDLSNRALYCVPCAKKKTKEDLGRIAKAKRQAEMMAPREPKRRWGSRGFG